MENPIKRDDLGVHLFWKHPFIVVTVDFSMIFQFSIRVRWWLESPKEFFGRLSRESAFWFEKVPLTFPFENCYKVLEMQFSKDTNERSSRTFLCVFLNNFRSGFVILQVWKNCQNRYGPGHFFLASFVTSFFTDICIHNMISSFKDSWHVTPILGEDSSHLTSILLKPPSTWMYTLDSFLLRFRSCKYTQLINILFAWM